jgi:hypothetical protein
MKNPALKYLTPAIAGACLGLLPSGAQAQVTPVFDATFPASWNGTSTTVTDQSSAGNIGFQSGTATYSSGSMVLGGAGGIKVTGNGTTFPTDAILNNTAIAADGGFTYNIDFLWNGATNATQKLIDYAGTESLQLNGQTGGLTMSFANDTGVESTPVSTTLTANTWYDVTLTFDTAGNSLVGGDISGIADLYVNGALVSSGAATKGIYGDGLNRPIGIGEFGYGHTTSILGLHGDISDASIDLGVAPVPEPSTLALSALGGIGFIGMIWKGRRKA